MLNPGYTNVDEILERVRRDFGFEDVIKDEVKEWLWDFIGIIEIVDAYTDKFKEIVISDYRGNLPEDLIGIYNGGVRQKDTYIPLIHMGDVWYQDQDAVASLTTYQQNLFANEHTYYAVDNVEDEEEETGFLMSQPRINVEDQYTYKIKGDYIWCGLKEDTIQIAYQAFPTNEDGTPAIPNDPKVIRSATNWIARNIAFRLNLKDELSDRKLDRIEQELAWSIGSAQNKAKMPSIDQFEAISKRWMRLLPDIDNHRSGFRYLGNAERIRSI
jgi:hypothetical protein